MSVSSTGTVPAGWYPDPSGAAQWRRWDGTTWGEATMPYGPPPPDPAWVLREELTWSSLRVFAPLALIAPAASAVVLAAQTGVYGPIRQWFRRVWSDDLHGRPTPPVPTVQGSPIASATDFAVLIAVIVGLLAWSRFCKACIRVSVLARYPQQHSPGLASLSLLLPLVGPFVASSATRESLPKGHEARRVLEWGWRCVVLGQLALVGTVAVVWSTPSLVGAWVAAGACVLAWAAASVLLPIGLGAISEDHATLHVRSAVRPS